MYAPAVNDVNVPLDKAVKRKFFAKFNSDVKAKLVHRGVFHLYHVFPCGRCSACRFNRMTFWGLRCMKECQSHESNLFVTLTYDDAHLPANRGLVAKEFPLFMRRLRSRFPGVRYFACGEYGSNFGRPHYHAILFGLSLPDLEFISKSPRGDDLYSSNVLASIWGKGFVTVGAVTMQSARYVAGYVLDKKYSSPDDPARYERVIDGEVVQVLPELVRISSKPAIGLQWFLDNYKSVVANRCVYHDTQAYQVPKYYVDKLLDIDILSYMDLKDYYSSRSNSEDVGSEEDFYRIRRFRDSVFYKDKRKDY